MPALPVCLTMKGTPTLLCFLAVLITGHVTSQNLKCLDDLRARWQTTRCSNTDEYIACVQGAITANPALAQSFAGYLQYLKEKKQGEVSCPQLEEKGSCISFEMSKCFEEINNSAKKRCDRAPTRRNCLLNIQAICSDEELQYQITTLNDDINDCKDGWLKDQMEWEECLDKETECTKEYHVLYDSQQYRAAQEKLVPSIYCLERLNCGNAKEYAQYLQGLLKNV